MATGIHCRETAILMLLQFVPADAPFSFRSGPSARGRRRSSEACFWPTKQPLPPPIESETDAALDAPLPFCPRPYVHGSYGPRVCGARQDRMVD